MYLIIGDENRKKRTDMRNVFINTMKQLPRGNFEMRSEPEEQMREKGKCVKKEFRSDYSDKNYRNKNGKKVFLNFYTAQRADEYTKKKKKKKLYAILGSENIQILFFSPKKDRIGFDARLLEPKIVFLHFSVAVTKTVLKNFIHP